jgi:hypothetical protein
MRPPPGEWSPADATAKIRACAASNQFSLDCTGHALDQMADRDLIIGDVLHLLKNGFVYDRPQPASRGGFFKYAMEGKTPNSEARFVRIIVIPDPGVHAIKVVTVMWKDER